MSKKEEGLLSSLQTLPNIIHRIEIFLGISIAGSSMGIYPKQETKGGKADILKINQLSSKNQRHMGFIWQASF